MKPIDVKPSIYILGLIKKIIRKVLNLKLVMLEYQNIKIFSGPILGNNSMYVIFQKKGKKRTKKND